VIEYTDEMRSYFSLFYFIAFRDLNKVPFFESISIEPSPCDPSDFDHEGAKPIYEDWMNIAHPDPQSTMLCMD